MTQGCARGSVLVRPAGLGGEVRASDLSPGLRKNFLSNSGSPNLLYRSPLHLQVFYSSSLIVSSHPSSNPTPLDHSRGWPLVSLVVLSLLPLATLIATASGYCC